MKCTRIAYKKEPVLHVHRYIVVVGKIREEKKRGNSYWYTSYKYCRNLKEVAEAKRKAPRGSVIEVFKAKHDFRNAWCK